MARMLANDASKHRKAVALEWDLSDFVLKMTEFLRHSERSEESQGSRNSMALSSR
jgi:hypothetical protein